MSSTETTDAIAVIRERNPIDEVVSEYVVLRRAGADFLKGLCPFHDEKTPSFTVRPGPGTFHCFGCGEGGSVIDFLIKIEHLGFAEAVGRLAIRSSRDGMAGDARPEPDAEAARDLESLTLQELGQALIEAAIVAERSDRRILADVRPIPRARGVGGDWTSVVVELNRRRILAGKAREIARQAVEGFEAAGRLPEIPPESEADLRRVRDETPF